MSSLHLASWFFLSLLSRHIYVAVKSFDSSTWLHYTYLFLGTICSYKYEISYTKVAFLVCFKTEESQS